MRVRSKISGCSRTNCSMAPSTSATKAGTWRAQLAVTVPGPYWQDCAPGAPGLGEAGGWVAGAKDGRMDGVTVGVELGEPEQATSAASEDAATTLRMEKGDE